MKERNADPTPPGGSGRAGRIAALLIALLIVLALLWVLLFPRTRWFEPPPHDDPAAVPTPQ
jgi:hypothetical protein